MHILLAEDDHHVALITRICLEKIGAHTVETAEDGARALELAQSGAYDLILLDSMMPKKQGLQVAQELRDSGYTTPIIFLSAKSVEEEFLELGQGFINKPFEPSTICALIDEIMQRFLAQQKLGTRAG